ncbi:MAG: jacalin-like lectin [Minicystis sp.]
MNGYIRSQEFGGDGGDPFSDDLTEVCRLVQVNIRYASEIDGIQCEWESPSGARVTGPWHGGHGGDLTHFTLLEGEHITHFEGRVGSRVDQLTFYTNKGNKFGPYGGTRGSEFSSPSDLRVTGFFGRAAHRLDAIGAFSPAPLAST